VSGSQAIRRRETATLATLADPGAGISQRLWAAWMLNEMRAVRRLLKGGAP